MLLNNGVRASVIYPPTDGMAVRCDAGQDAPPYPIVVFIPGWRSGIESYRSHLRDLAAEGFVVVGLEWPKTIRDAQGDLDLSSPEAFEDTLQRADAAARRYAGDVSAVLDALEQNRLQDATLVNGGVGVYGHSFGGAVAIQAALTDHRIQAAANIDGWLFAEGAAQTLQRPALLITDSVAALSPSDLSSRHPSARFETVLNARNAAWASRQQDRADFQLVEIPSASHGSFIGDGGWKQRLKAVRAFATNEPDPARTTISQLAAFFHRYLRCGEPDAP